MCAWELLCRLVQQASSKHGFGFTQPEPPSHLCWGDWSVQQTNTHTHANSHSRISTPACLDGKMLMKVCLSLLIILTWRVKSRCLPAQPGQSPSVWPADKRQAALGHQHTCHNLSRWGWVGGGKLGMGKGREGKGRGTCVGWWAMSEQIHQAVKKPMGI